MHPTDKTARIAGALYLALVFTGVFTLMYVPGKLIVRGDPAATAANILTHEMLFRTDIVIGLVSSVLFMAVALALYRLLSGVNGVLATLMVALVMISVTISFAFMLYNIAALVLFQGGGYLAVFSDAQRNALGLLFLHLDSQGNFVNEIFWGLWLIPFGVLVMRSRFLPWFLGLWLNVNGATYLALSFTALLFPNHYGAAYHLAMPLLFGEIAIALWLLIKGVKVRAKSEVAT